MAGRTKAFAKSTAGDATTKKIKAPLTEEIAMRKKSIMCGNGLMICGEEARRMCDVSVNEFVIAIGCRG